MGISIYDAFQTDMDAEQEGKWFYDILGDESGIDVKLRRFTSKASIKARQRITTLYRKFAKKNKFSDEMQDKIITEQMAEAIVVDWKGVLDSDGTEIPYSKDAALLLLTKLPNLRIALMQMAIDMDNFRTEAEEAALGN